MKKFERGRMVISNWCRKKVAKTFDIWPNKTSLALIKKSRTAWTDDIYIAAQKLYLALVSRCTSDILPRPLTILRRADTPQLWHLPFWHVQSENVASALVATGGEATSYRVDTWHYGTQSSTASSKRSTPRHTRLISHVLHTAHFIEDSLLSFDSF